MPSKNSIKKYKENGIYHIYNRGVNAQNIFLSKKDYYLFIDILKRVLAPSDQFSALKNYSQRINLLAFCLMPTHIHLLVKQKGKKDIAEFMQSIMLSFTARMNKRHERVGHLFQSCYKARLIESDEDFMGASRYIHTNPSEICDNLETYSYSTLGCYTHSRTGWNFVNTSLLLDYFYNSPESYRDFIEAGLTLKGSDP